MKVTIEMRTLTCEFIGATSHKVLDNFRLDLDSHKYQ